MIQLGETRRAEAGAQLSQINSVLNEQQVQSVTAEDIQHRTLIRAPYDGVVDKLAFNTIGGVIRPAETIMEIVPDRDRLLVEVAVSPVDIDRVVIGQEARIRFTAFSNTATPEIAGRVTHVAPERTDNPETGASFYAARVSVDVADLRDNPELVLRPGMPADVFIQTGSRPMISYITKPLQDQFARAFRDN
jgi:HlyD family secretion protein